MVLTASCFLLCWAEENWNFTNIIVGTRNRLEFRACCYLRVLLR